MTAKKETYYFSHDCNARNDEKILMLRSEGGMEAYGIYWALIEMMFENTETQLNLKNTKGIAMHLNINNELLEKTINICVELELFESDNNMFWSNSLRKRKDIYLDLKKKKSEAGKKGMAKRWGSDNTVITEDNTVITEDNKGKESKGKESKGKESKGKENKFSDDSLEIKISKYLFKKISLNDVKTKEPNYQKWAEDIDKLMRIDKRNDNEEILKIIDYATNNEFWKSNILSAKKLREHYPKLLLQMINNSNKKQSYYKPEATTKNDDLENKALDQLISTRKLRLVK